MQKVFLYNTPERKKVEFVPIVPGKIGIYSCGPTVYWDQHIGNMYAFVCWDLLVRSLRYFGYDVTWVMNITDVGHLTSDADSGEDKMEKGAKREGISAWEIAKKYERQFLDSLEMLNVNYPKDKHMPHATDYIEEQIKMVLKLEKNGFTYKTNDGIYYDTSKFANYAEFAHLNLEELKAGASVEVNPEKKNPTDFALWKFSPVLEKRQMEWDSPWGVGFPGWHLECTAMSTALLGEKFDIHTGGQEHIKIHHTNEIAQGFGVFGGQTANYWIHNGWLTMKEKMSKSLGNVYTVDDLQKKGYDPVAFRYMVCTTHYHKGMEFSFESLKSAEEMLGKIKNILIGVGDSGLVSADFKKRFLGKLADDLAMPQAMAVVWEMLRSDLRPEDKKATWLDFDKVLGLNLDLEEELLPQEVLTLAKARQVAKQKKDWVQADLFRNRLRELGFVVEDKKDDYIVKRISV